MPNPNQFESVGWGVDVALAVTPYPRRNSANLAIRNPKPIKEIDVRIQARNVRSAAR
jgi:hypothetical protein